MKYPHNKIGYIGIRQLAFAPSFSSIRQCQSVNGQYPIHKKCLEGTMNLPLGLM